jgi:AcrR family transcriptional regulator
MNDRSPSGLEKLWMREQLESKPRLGLSLERIIESGIELADGDGLAAVSMKRVAESLGFTTMSLYRHVASKDELLLLMQDSAWRPPDGLDVPHGGWREDLAWWTREQYAIMERHPWLDEVRFIERAGTPSQIAWMDLGLRALSDVQLSEYRKVAVLLLLSGYVSSTARLALTSREGAQRGLFAPDEATAAFGELLRTIVDPGRYPALFRAVGGGAFAPVEGELYAPLDFGLQLMLDGIERLIGA